MNYLPLKTIKKASSIALFLLLFISNSTIFAQNEKNLVDLNTVPVVPSVKQENGSTLSASNSNTLHFILWFMGSKQDINNTLSTDGTNTKKQVITSGTAPNRLLIKTFLKKAVDLENMMA